jgi:hypothetical protein
METTEFSMEPAVSALGLFTSLTTSHLITLVALGALGVAALALFTVHSLAKGKRR